MKYILTLALLSLVVALLRGGRLTRLAQVPFRHAYLAVLSLVLQMVIFSSWWTRVGGEPWIPSLYVLSMLILTAWFGLNFRLPGMAVIGLGLLLNLAAIASNGGRMPASLAALEYAGMIYRAVDPQQATPPILEHNGVVYKITDPTQEIPANFAIATQETRFYYLADIIPVPKGFPNPIVFSVGDVLITLGAMYFLQRVLTDERLDPVPAPG
jgi:hypothetical protein